MIAHAPLLSTIAVGLVAAFIFGFAATKARLSPIVGYLAAGLLIGPHTPGIIADVEVGKELSEIGVVLLMFGVGLHFSMSELLAVRKVALPGAIAQMAFATGLGTALGLWFGWSVGASALFGLALSVASTVVMLRALEDRQLLDTRAGHIAVGWLIVEDLAMVLALVVIPVLAEGEGGAGALAAGLGVTVVKVAAFVALMIIVGRRVVPWLLAKVADTGSRELFTLGVLALGLGVAVGAAWLFDVSFALGAFFAGMILKESPLAHRAAADSLPLRDAFAVLFFVSVGMLVDPAVVWHHPWGVIGTTAVIVIGKFVVAFVLVRAMRYSKSMSLVAGAALAQIGEFSFILVTLGGELHLIPDDARDLVLAGAILSIVINPALFAWASASYRAKHAPSVNVSAEAPAAFDGSDHVIVVGDGRVGARAAASLRAQGQTVVMVDDDEDRVTQARQEGHDAILGNAVRSKVLSAAGVERCKAVLVAIPDPLTAGAVVEQIREQCGDALILARGHNDTDVKYLTERGADEVLVGVYEVADLMVERASEPAERD